MIDDSEKSKNTKVNISQDAITEWLLQNKVLSIAFESKLQTVLFLHLSIVHVSLDSIKGRKEVLESKILIAGFLFEQFKW